MTQLHMPIWLPLIIAFFSGGLLASVMRGRRIDDHPPCAKRGYDLIGRGEFYEPPAALPILAEWDCPVSQTFQIYREADMPD